MTRIAPKTTALTIHVEPKSNAMWTTPLVSRSMKPAPRKNIRPFGRAVRTGAKAGQDHERDPGDERHPAEVERGDDWLSEVEERPGVGRQRPHPACRDPDRADLGPRTVVTVSPRRPVAEAVDAARWPSGTDASQNELPASNALRTRSTSGEPGMPTIRQVTRPPGCRPARSRRRGASRGRSAGAEHLLRQRGQAADDPALAEGVVHHERPARLELRLDVAERLLGEQEALQPEAGIPRVEHERIDQRVRRQVILPAGRLDEAAAVVEVSGDPAVGVGAVRDGRSARSAG